MPSPKAPLPVCPEQSPSHPTSSSSRESQRVTVVYRDIDRLRRLAFRIYHNGILFGKSRPVAVVIDVCLEKRQGPGEKHQFVSVLETASFDAGQLTFPVFNHFACERLRHYAKVIE